MPKNYAIGYPTKYQNWNLFFNVVLDSMNLNDCNDTVSGICENTRNVQDCIKICEESKDLCDGGYFVETENKNYCVPLRNYPQNATTYAYYRFRTKDYYPELKNSKVTFFLQDDYPFPPYIANTIFYQDHFVLKIDGTNFTLGYNKNTDGVTAALKLDSNTETLLQFLPVEIMRSFVEKYVMVYDGDEIAINIPHTAFILRKGIDSPNLEWLMRATSFKVSTNIFTIHKENGTKGENINYQEKVFFRYYGHIVYFNSENGQLEISNKSNEADIRQEKLLYLFSFIPKVKVYYCENKECKDTSLDKCRMEGQKAYYNNILVDRNPSCWGICEKKSFTNENILIISLIIAIILILLLHFLKRK